MHLFDERQAADARADDYADAVAVFPGHVQPRVIDGHLRGGHGIVDERVGLLDLFLVDPRAGIEPAHLAGDLAGELAGIELGDPADAGAPLDEPLPGGLVADAQRGDHPDAGDDDASLFQSRLAPKRRTVSSVSVGYVHGSALLCSR